KVYELYEAAVRRHPADVALRRKAIDVALRIRRFNDALEHLKFLLRGPRANDGELEQLEGFCLAATHESKQAAESYEKAIQHAPKFRTSYIQLAELYSHMNQVSEGDRVMRALVQTNPGDYQAHLARARYLAQQRRPLAEQEEEIRHAYRLAPQQADAILAM